MPDHLPDGEFEKLFQKGSEQYDFEYNPQAWENMEVLLNKRKRKKLALWWFGSFLILVLFVSIGFASGLFNLDQDKNLTTEDGFDRLNTMPASESSYLESVKDQEGFDHLDRNEFSSSEGNMTNAPDMLKKQSLSSRNNIHSDLKESDLVNHGEKSNPGNESDHLSSFNLSTQTEITENEYNVDVDPGNTTGGIENKSAVYEHSLTEQTTGELVVNDIDQVERVRQINVRRLWTSPVLGIPFTTLNSSSEYPFPDRLIRSDSEAVNSSALILGASLGLSSSSAGSMGYSDFDMKAGLSVQYFFNLKWSFSGGLNYIKDSYNAGSEDYAPGYGYWIDMVVPNWTDASCEILELPLSLSYFPAGYHSSGFFASAGIASAIMVSEEYYYNYEDPKPEYRKYWHGNMDSKDWFSTLEFSVGYQKKLSNKSFMRFQPFIQLPVNGIGHGNVMLRNVGLSIQYGFKVK